MSSVPFEFEGLRNEALNKSVLLIENFGEEKDFEVQRETNTGRRHVITQ
jgi:hypothetical protein